jgi:large subunit ribosomal protein L24
MAQMVNTKTRYKIRLRKGDLVIVLKGKDRGKKGKILRVLPIKDRVIVERVNFVKKHSRPTQNNPKGGIIEQEAPIRVANVALYCEKCGAGRRTRSHEIEAGKKARVCVKCGETLGTQSA